MNNMIPFSNFFSSCLWATIWKGDSIPVFLHVKNGWDRDKFKADFILGTAWRIELLAQSWVEPRNVLKRAILSVTQPKKSSKGYWLLVILIFYSFCYNNFKTFLKLLWILLCSLLLSTLTNLSNLKASF